MLRRLSQAFFNNAYILLTLVALFWAGNLVVGRAAAGHVPPITMSAIRWSVAALIITPFARKHLRRDWPALRSHWPVMVLLCAISAAHVTLNYVALNVTSALNALTLQSITPVLIVVFCFLLFGDRMTALQLIGVSTSLTGVLVVVTRGSLETLLRLAINWGDLVVVFTMTILAIYTAMLRKRPATHWLSFTALLYIVSALLNLPFAAWETSSGRVLTLDLPSLAALAYVAIFPSLLAYIFYNRGVELIGGGRAGAFTHLTPLFGAVLAMVFLGEKLMAFHVVGFILILSGIALTVMKRT